MGVSKPPSTDNGGGSSPEAQRKGIPPGHGLTPEELKEVHEGVAELLRQGLLEPATLEPDRYDPTKHGPLPDFECDSADVVKVLTHDQRPRILRDVILGVPPPDDESPEAKEWRAAMAKDKAAADAAGLMLDIPFDW